MNGFDACRFVGAATAIAWAMGWALPVAAQPLSPPAEVSTCAACHGADGISIAADIPNLAGQKTGYIVAQLQAFREGRRKNDLMAAIAAQLDEPKAKALAAYWSSLPPSGSGTKPEPMASKMTMPAEFPKGFSEYQRTSDAKAKVFTVRYANEVAWSAAQRGQPLPPGSVLMQVNHAAKLDASGAPLTDGQGRWISEKIVGYSGMESRAGWGEAVPALLRNGDWQYGVFTPEGTPRIGSAMPRCLACHQPRGAESFTFTLAELKKAAAR